MPNETGSVTQINLIIFIKKKRALGFWGSSGQDGGTGRNPSLPRTTKRRMTTNLKSIKNQKCQKIKQHGTPTTKELKKQSTRTTTPVKWWMQRNRSEEADYVGRADQTGNWDSELTVDYGGVATVGETPGLTPGFIESGWELSRQAALFPLWPLPNRQQHSAAKRVALPWWIPKPPPLTT